MGVSRRKRVAQSIIDDNLKASTLFWPSTSYNGALLEVGVPVASSRGIFLSYRRADTAPYARLLQVQLRERFPDVRIFLDMDSIEAGMDFAEVIREAIDSCAVLVALIGGQWATLLDEEGRRRVDNPDDYVRFEIQTALERRVRVIPVLVDSAMPLREEQLPAELHRLARLQALELSLTRYEYDASRLLNLIQQVLAAPPSTLTLAPPDVPRNGNTLDQASQKGPEAARRDRSRATRVLIDARGIAESITDENLKASALADIAKALAATDPDRAAGLIADAERIAQSITSNGLRAIALADITGTLAATDPDRAERIARSITREVWKARALADVARGLAATDPDRAERIAQSITREALQEEAIAEIAGALAATDPDRAERIAQSITSDGWKAIALGRVARALAATDPDRAAWLLADAQRIARTFTGSGDAEALADIAGALAVTDADQAERIAQSISSDSWKAIALAAVARALAATEPDHAERIAQSASDGSSKVSALAEIASAVAVSDPDRAARLFAEAEQIARFITNDSWKARALTDLARALATTNADRAEHIAQSITDKYWKVVALASIAET